jgi:enamine deaminase RidA (YjgF/YER057c/UK114 family)
MTTTPDERLAELDVDLPPAPEPGGSYRQSRRAGRVLYLAGTTSTTADGAEEWTGQVGAERTVEEGRAAARVCARNLLARIDHVAGSLDAVERFLHVNGYVNAVAGYGDSPLVVNGASDLLVDVYGEAGEHTRTAVSVAGLPGNATVEVQAEVLLAESALPVDAADD